MQMQMGCGNRQIDRPRQLFDLSTTNNTAGGAGERAGRIRLETTGAGKIGGGGGWFSWSWGGRSHLPPEVDPFTLITSKKTGAVDGRGQAHQGIHSHTGVPSSLPR